MIRLGCLALLAASLHAADVTKPPPAHTIAEIPSPAPARSLGASLTTGPNGTAWLSWVEPGRGGINTLRYSTLDLGAKKWRSPRTIATGTDVAANATDFPQLAINDDGEATAIWTDGRGGALYSQSHDGLKWSQRQPWTGESTVVEMISCVALADGRTLAVWLDGRAHQTGGPAGLYARIVGAAGPDVLVDASVCDCCPTSLTAFPDGSALVAYRGRTGEEVRDIRVARFRGRAWDEPRTVNQDDWRINGCPVNGPRLVSDGGRVALAWFTAANNEPRVIASYSPDAGGQFLMPLRLDRGKPAGHVDTLLLRDSTMLVSWVEQGGGWWLRRINPEFSATEPISLAAAGNGKVKGIPRLAMLHNYAGGATHVQLVAAFTPDDPNAGVHTLVITIPEGDLLAAERNCDCTPNAAELQGFPFRGAITQSLPSPGTLRVKHPELPGIFPEGTHEFRVSSEVLVAVPPGREFLARVERRNGEWWLFDVRLLGR